MAPLPQIGLQVRRSPSPHLRGFRDFRKVKPLFRFPALFIRLVKSDKLGM